jgi:predicted small integral membrane protein
MMIELPPQWMYWTVPTLLFVGFILLMLIGLSIWDAEDPGWARQGILPIETTRGDRVFMSILTTLAVFCFWLYVAGTSAVWGVLVFGAVATVGIMNFF